MQFYDIYKNEVIANASELTDFSDGSMHDIVTGALSAGLNEICELILIEFSKTYFDLAEGADIDKLAVDHFGESFARPAASKSTGAITFSRANTDAGDVTIPIGTVVKTAKDSNGVELRFVTTVLGTMTGLTLSVDIEAVEAGPDSRVQAAKIIVLESSLTDSSVTVSNPLAMAGGEDAPTDESYREIIRSLIKSLAGATESAVKAAALTVLGVANVALVTTERIVIDYDIGLDQIVPGAIYFRIPYVYVYISDEDGNSSSALIAAVKEKLVGVRAAGVKIEALGGIAVPLSWTASVTLDSGGPSFIEFQTDTSRIVDTMNDYINKVLAIGADFIKADANTYIMSIWGPTGTGDLTGFSSSVPSGNVTTAVNEKLIAATVSII